MHTFQPMPVDLIEINPFTKIGKEWSLLTAGIKTDLNSMTISWGGVGVLWGKNVVFVFVRDSRYTREYLNDNEFFSLTFFDEQYREALNYCGSHSGREGGKLEGAGLTPAFHFGIPYIDEGNLVLLCKKMAATKLAEDSFLVPEIMEKWYPNGDMHTMYIGEILNIMAR